MDDFDRLIQIERWFKNFTKIQQINMIKRLAEIHNA